MSGVVLPDHLIEKKRYNLAAEWDEREAGAEHIGSFDTMDSAEARIAEIDAADQEAEYLIGAELVLTDTQTGKQWFYSDQWEELD